MSTDDAGHSKGFAFVEFEDEARVFMTEVVHNLMSISTAICTGGAASK